MDQKQLNLELERLSKIPCGEPQIVLLVRRHLESNADDHEAAVVYANALRVCGRFGEASHVLESAYDRSHAPLTRARIAIQMALVREISDPNGAEVWYERAFSCDDRQPGWVSILRGANLARQEKFDAALQCYSEALTKSDTERAEALKNIALIYRAKEQFSDARVYLQRALMAAPDDRQAAEILAGLPP